MCILKELEVSKREKMLQYYALPMQDAFELNFFTIKRVHAAVLKEIEKGKVNWDELDLIEKTKTRYTQRLLQNQRTSNGATVQMCNHFNKGLCRVDNDQVANGILYQHCSSFWLKDKCLIKGFSSLQDNLVMLE